MSKAVDDILTERQRQVTVEGFDQSHDDGYCLGELARAATFYAGISERRPNNFANIWPWSAHCCKPTNKRQNLVKAGALIIAEIERLDRLSDPKP